MLSLLPFFALTVTISGESSLGNHTSKVCSALVVQTFMGGASERGGERRFRADGDSGHMERMLMVSEPEPSDEDLPAPRLLVGVGGVGILGGHSALARGASMSERRCLERIDGESERSRPDETWYAGTDATVWDPRGSE